MNFDHEEIAYIFTGQGSQTVGMGKDLARDYSIAREIFAEADEIIEIPLSQIAWEGPEIILNDTINTQPALLVHSIVVLNILESNKPDLNPLYVAGHSMGELSALVAAGCLTFQDGLRLVRTRGELMKRAGELTPGGMAAILGLETDVVEKICFDCSSPGEPVQIANDNCPGQIVISGSKPALERAMKLAPEFGARKVVPLMVSIAAHSPLMLQAQEKFSEVVNKIPILAPKIPLIGNVTARPLNSVSEIRNDLQAQLDSRVRWTESIQWLVAAGVTTFLELGNNNVLTGLLKRISREVHGIQVGNSDDVSKFLVN